MTFESLEEWLFQRAGGRSGTLDVCKMLGVWHVGRANLGF